jgi:hypothetical protein
MQKQKTLIDKKLDEVSKAEYILTVKTTEKTSNRKYKKLGWAFKAYRKLTKYPNVLQVNIGCVGGRYKNHIILHYTRNVTKGN